MATVTTTVALSMSPEGMSLEALEAEIGQALQRAGQELLVQACHTLEVGLLERQPSRLRRGKQRPLHLLTRFGWTRLSRWQMRDQAGTFRCPLDALLGLQPRQHASPWVTHQAVALATRLPYRQATSLLSSWLQASVDHRSLYRWVQAAGAPPERWARAWTERAPKAAAIAPGPGPTARRPPRPDPAGRPDDAGVSRKAGDCRCLIRGETKESCLQQGDEEVLRIWRGRRPRPLPARSPPTPEGRSR
jgi:hypothetical protein